MPARFSLELDALNQGVKLDRVPTQQNVNLALHS